MPDSTSALINQLTNPPNPFEKFGATVDFANKLMDFQANKTAADAYRQSIDPETGAFDQGKFNALTSQAPGGSWQFGKRMQESGEGFRAQGAGTQQDIQAKQEQLNAAGNLMYPLYQRALVGAVPANEVQAVFDQAHSMGLVNDQQYQRTTQTLNGMGPDGDARGVVLGANMGNKAAQLATGNVVPVQTGQQTVFPQTSPGGVASPAAPVQHVLSPQNIADLQKWLAEGFSWTDTAGKAHTGTKADFYKSRGQDPYKLFGSNNIPAPGSDPPGGPVSTVTTGRQPVKPAAATPAAPSSGAGAPASGATAPGVMGTLPATPPTLPTPSPAAQPAPTPPPAPPSDSTVAIPPEQIEAGRKAYAQDQDVQSTLGTRVGPLESAISTLRAHPNLQTVGQDEINQLTQVANAFGFKIGNLNNANAYQELSKYLEGYLRNLPGANRSDLSQTQAAAASPHIGQGREPMQALLAKAVGYERLRAASYDYFNSQYPDATTASKDSGQYKTKTSSWLATQDPVAYAVDEMTPQQYTSYISGLSDAGKAKLKASRQSAIALYPWLYPPGMAPVAPQAPAAP